MIKDSASYRQSIKGISVFGGLQVFIVLIGVARSKIVAILLGSSGMGIIALFNSTIELIAALTDFNLKTAAVQKIASFSNNIQKLSKIKITLQKLVWITGFFGALVCFLSAEFLSEITFDSDAYTNAFRWLSVVLFVNQLCDAQNALLQGLRKIKQLVKANMFGALVGLLFSLPLYYYYGFEGIAPAIIVFSIAMWLFATFFVQKIKFRKVQLSFKEIFGEGKEMLQMGLMLSLAGMISLAATYFIRVYIAKVGGLEQVGFYTAGFALINTYVGLIFKAMSFDFFPRLSFIIHNKVESIKAINQQSEITILLLAPILCLLMIFVNWVVVLIYTSEFTVISGMLQWASLGMVFKASVWAASLQFLAKGHGWLFLWNELALNSYTLILNILGYHYFQLNGLGISFLVSYLIYFLQVWAISQHKYGFRFGKTVLKLLIIQLSLCSICFFAIKQINVDWLFLFLIAIVALSVFISYKELNKRLNFKQLIADFRGKQ